MDVSDGNYSHTTFPKKYEDEFKKRWGKDSKNPIERDSWLGDILTNKLKEVDELKNSEECLRGEE